MQKRSLTLAGHRTSVALEPEFWEALEQMADRRQLSLPALIREIDEARGGRSLASASRIAALQFAQDPQVPPASIVPERRVGIA